MWNSTTIWNTLKKHATITVTHVAWKEHMCTTCHNNKKSSNTWQQLFSSTHENQKKIWNAY
jgi:adenylate kinase